MQPDHAARVHDVLCGLFIEELRGEMRAAARQLEVERAAPLRDAVRPAVRLADRRQDRGRREQRQ